jgi:hypothetical protein
MNKNFEYGGYQLKQEITLEFTNWEGREIVKPLVISGTIEEFRIGMEGCLLWINYDNNDGYVEFKDMTTAYLNTGWEDIKFINKYIKK